MQTIKINVTAEGSVTVAVSGVKGTGCKALTADIERALGTVTSDKNTSEYTEQEQHNAANQG